MSDTQTEPKKKKPIVRAEKVLTGDEFKAWRLSRGYSQAALAREFGMTYQAIYHLDLHGATQLHALAMAALDAALKAYSPTREQEEGQVWPQPPRAPR